MPAHRAVPYRNGIAYLRTFRCSPLPEPSPGRGPNQRSVWLAGWCLTGVEKHTAGTANQSRTAISSPLPINLSIETPHERHPAPGSEKPSSGSGFRVDMSVLYVKGAAHARVFLFEREKNSRISLFQPRTECTCRGSIIIPGDS